MIAGGAWERPGAPDRFRVVGLAAGHPARAVRNVDRRLAEPPLEAGPRGAARRATPAVRPPVDAAAHALAGAGPAPHRDDAVPPRVRGVGEQEAAQGPDVLAEAFDAARVRPAARRPDIPLPARRGVRPRTGARPVPAHPLVCVEFVVHLDDPAVGLAAPTPSVPAGRRRGDLLPHPHHRGTSRLTSGAARPWPAVNGPPVRSPRSDHCLRRAGPNATPGTSAPPGPGPELAIVDIRMPPDHATEGLKAASHDP